jgi:tetratricopeptide (TPR) repeat protein
MKHLLTLILLFAFLLSLSQKRVVDSILTLLNNANTDTAKIRLRYVCGEAAKIYRISFWDSLANDAQRLGAEKYYALSLNNIGYMQDNQGKTSDAFDMYYKSMEILRRIGDKENLASTINNLGIVYKRQGMMQKALECYFESRKIREDINDKHGLAYALSNIAVIYATLGEREKGLVYDLQALKIREEIGDKEGVSQSLSNLGVDYIYTEPTKALDYFIRSLKIRREIGGARWEAATLNNIGFVFFTLAQKEKDIAMQKDFVAKALDYYTQSEKISVGLADKNGLSYSYYYIGSAYMITKEYQKAEQFLNKGLDNAKATNNLELVKNIYDRLYKTYKSQNKIANALEMHEQFKFMTDSLNTRDNRNSAIKKQMQYDFEKKETLAKAEQEKKDTITKEETKKKNMILGFITIGFLVMAFFAFYVFRSLRTTQKQKSIIEDQKKIVEVQKIMVEEKQKEILDSIHYAKRIQDSLLPTDFYIDREVKRLKN